MEHRITIIGTITDVFAHRFVIETGEGRTLADLTPGGADKVPLRVGDRVTLIGEMKPSELKVETFTRDGGESIIIDHKKPPHHNIGADPKTAMATAERNGYEVLGPPKRKPKHFEVLGRSRDGAVHELHIELNGHLRKIVQRRSHHR